MRYYLYFPGNSDGTESAWNAGDLGLILGSDPWVGKIFWRREWQPTPVFLPGEFHGQRSLTGYSPQGCRVGHSSLVLVWATNTNSGVQGDILFELLVVAFRLMEVSCRFLLKVSMLSHPGNSCGAQSTCLSKTLSIWHLSGHAYALLPSLCPSPASLWG